jgi:biopolymer transport protein ExbD
VIKEFNQMLEPIVNDVKRSDLCKLIEREDKHLIFLNGSFLTKISYEEEITNKLKEKFEDVIYVAKDAESDKETVWIQLKNKQITAFTFYEKDQVLIMADKKGPYKEMIDIVYDEYVKNSKYCYLFITGEIKK